MTSQIWLYPLPNGKILDVTKLKAFVCNKLKVAKMIISIFERVENTVGKGESAGNQHFLLFAQCFQKPSFQGSLKVGIVWEKYLNYFLVNKNHCGKRRKCCLKAFSPFKQCF